MKISIESNILKYIFKNVYFINGTAYAGKSTMIKKLAEKYKGVCCGENYHLEFVNRLPEDYDNWITESAKEIAELELVLLIQYKKNWKENIC